MRIVLVAPLLVSLAGCGAFERDGVKQCRDATINTLKSPASYKEAGVQVVDLNPKHPEDLQHQTQRWVTITYDAVNSYNAPMREEHMCQFFLQDGKIAGEVPQTPLEPVNMK